MSEHRPRLLLAGVGPLPPERPERLFAPGVRIWGMARELAHAGHPVRLVTVAFGQPPDTAWRYDLEPGAAVHLPQGFARELPERGLAGLLAAEAVEWGADAAVGSSDRMNHALATAGLDLPIWMDFFGDPMAERQMLALHEGSDEGLDDQWALLAAALARGDRVSGCSTDQCAALLGELAAVGRLGRQTADCRLVTRLAPWIEPIAPTPATTPLLRGRGVPEAAFLVVQTGGFNTWLDVEGLFAVLEKSMAGDERIHFATTGGAIPGHHGSSHGRFTELVKSSPHKDRYHSLGWLPLGDVPRLLAEADLGLNLDRPTIEGILGTRNRLLDWLLAGLPVLTTPGCELAVELGEEGLVTLVPHGDPTATARALLAVAADPAPRRRAARRAPDWLAKHHAAIGCLRPLLDWAAAPKSAPDLRSWKAEGATSPRLWRQASQAPEHLADQRREAEKAAWMAQKLARLEGSRWVRLALRLRGRDDLKAPSEAR